MGRAHYGFNHVKTAAEHDAIETLLMSDSVFRIKDFKQRRKYVDLVEQVRHLRESYLSTSAWLGRSGSNLYVCTY